MSLENLASISKHGWPRSKTEGEGGGGEGQKKEHNQQEDIFLVYQNILTCLVH